MNSQELAQRFETVFETKQPQEFFAPGRINLIGEHTDYNGGHVFPCAITIGTYGLATKRQDTLVNIYSENFPDVGILSFDLANLDYRKTDNWGNYPKGVIRYLKENGHQIDTGVDILFYGTIPNGAGLSSSASIELLTGVIFQELFHLELAELELILVGKRVENEFIGVNSGIMDQFAIGMGKKDQAILLDCDTLEYEMIPVVLGEHRIVIMNTNKRRELADSKYNERRTECERALALLQTELKIESLGQLDEATFMEHQTVIKDETLIKRAKHAVTENQRTLKAATALKAGDLATFGELMNASHRSLRNDYEVSGVELDTLVEAAWQQPGVIGARMTGAGFGGCGIAIVATENIPTFIEEVGQSYQAQIGYAADFYVASISDGAKTLEEA